MGQIKNIKLHIVTDIKKTLRILLRQPRWANIQRNRRTQQSRAKHAVRTSVFTSRTREKQLKQSRKCTSGKLTGILKMLLPRNRSFPSDALTAVWAIKLKLKLTVALREDGLSNQLNSYCSF